MRSLTCHITASGTKAAVELQLIYTFLLLSYYFLIDLNLAVNIAIQINTKAQQVHSVQLTAHIHPIQSTQIKLLIIINLLFSAQSLPIQFILHWG